MSFDKPFIEKARRDDAMDRLRQLREEFSESQRKQEERRDLRLRIWCLVAITLVVVFAIYRL